MSIATVTQSTGRAGPGADRNAFRLSATLMFIGFVVFGVLNLQFLHPGSTTPTDQAQFAAYAKSSIWTAVHLGQFVGFAGIAAGLLVLFFALNVWRGPARWPGFLAVISAAVAWALAAVVYAVDGVALKRAVDAWASAPATEKATRFANAEVIRWLETGTRSYQEFMWGLALVLFAITIVWTARISRPIGYLMGLSGLLNIVLGWLAGTQGLTNATRSAIFDISALPGAAWIIWLVIVAWRMKESEASP
jgi:hypothetical protein